MADKQEFVGKEPSKFLAAYQALREVMRGETPAEKEDRGFSFNDRAALIADLLALKYRPVSPLESWILQIQARLLQAPAGFDRLAAALDPLPQQGGAPTRTPASGTPAPGTPAPGTPAPGTPAPGAPGPGAPVTPGPVSPAPISRSIDANDVKEVLDQALRLAENHPVATFGRDVRHLLGEMVDDAVTRTAFARVVRWALPALIALVVGGTIWGSFEVKGLYDRIQTGRKEVDKEVSQFNELAGKQSREVKTAGDAVLTAVQEKLNGEVNKSAGLIETTVRNEQAKAEATGKKAAEDVLKFYEQQKDGFLRVQAEKGGERLDERVEAILADFMRKQRNVATQTSSLTEAIAAALAESGAPAQIKSIREEITQLDNEVGGLKRLAEETSDLRRALDTAAGGARLTAGQLVSIMQIKDYLTILALIFSIACAFFAASVARKGTVGNAVLAGMAGLLAGLALFALLSWCASCG
jgi:hypothetical protein